MTFAAVCLCAVLVTLPFGLAFLLAPEQVSSPYGIMGFNAGTLMVARLFGASLLLVAAAAFAVRTTADGALQRRFSGTFAAASVAAVFVAAHATLTGAVNALGWSTTLIYVLFTLAWTRIAVGAR
ncbi:hypothetical protein TBR22_A39790 [Luteitalea sp. TBR-22]|uniref:hypothetical protein n=1 Tax=Luteitalea sp. TBR-22 TaxID=2802971 RepID=UPI001AF52277|nr:hypothetical protein [Luteitalea sp. TBR-22]BCS34753.1 hypothetical protein TBR22_A39790 [Luteitalea sp. TBR-22]